MKYWEAIKAMQEGKKVWVPEEFVYRNRKWIGFDGNLFYSSDGSTGVSVQSLLVDMEKDYMLDDNWEIYEEPILDDAEKRYLKAVIRPFRDKVTGIAKISGETTYFISIWLCNKDRIQLPFFKKSENMYRGMEPERHYGLKDLGL